MPKHQHDESIQFVEGHLEGGEVVMGNVRSIKQSDIGRCRFTILIPSHYRADGSCKCSNREHREMMIKEWGYRLKQFAGIPLVD